MHLLISGVIFMFKGLKQAKGILLPLVGLFCASNLHAVSPSPYTLVDDNLFGLPITNSMVMSWVKEYGII